MFNKLQGSFKNKKDYAFVKNVTRYYFKKQNSFHNRFVSVSGEDTNDQATAESYWTPGHIPGSQESDDSSYVAPEEFFPTRGLVQTHPATFSGFGSTRLSKKKKKKNLRIQRKTNIVLRRNWIKKIIIIKPNFRLKFILEYNIVLY